MGQFPTLNQEDIDHLDAVLRELLTKSEANIALARREGRLPHSPVRQSGAIDTTTFATLGSNAYNAVQFMAQLVNENNFTSMYQQGENFSTLMVNVDENSLLVIVFPTHLTVGSMKYYAGPAVRSIAERIALATERTGTASTSATSTRRTSRPSFSAGGVAGSGVTQLCGSEVSQCVERRSLTLAERRSPASHSERSNVAGAFKPRFRTRNRPVA